MKKPFAYISAAWSGQEFTDTDQAAVYCRKVYLAGFTEVYTKRLCRTEPYTGGSI